MSEEERDLKTVTHALQFFSRRLRDLELTTKTELRRLRSELRRSRTKRLSKEEVELVGLLFRSVAGSHGSRQWTAPALMDSSPAVRTIVGDMSARSLGRLLSRCCVLRFEYCGLRLRRVGRSRNRVVYQLCQVMRALPE